MTTRCLRRVLPLILIGVAASAVATIGMAAEVAAEPPARVLLATTTSVQDSGLLSVLLPMFTEATGIRVQTVAVGSGAALRMGVDGTADILLTHAPAGEEKLVASGAVIARHPFMENYFVIAGPQEDPAGVAHASSAAAAFRRMAAAHARYVSRADDSGTQRREVALLKAASLDPEAGWSNFYRTGAGMGLTLQVAGERRAYVLSDIGTFLAFRKRIDLLALSRPEPSLRNVYSVLRVNPERFPGRIHAGPARALEEFLLGAEARKKILVFGEQRFGQPLFHPLPRDVAEH